MGRGASGVKGKLTQVVKRGGEALAKGGGSLVAAADRLDERLKESEWGPSSPAFTETATFYYQERTICKYDPQNPKHQTIQRKIKLFGAASSDTDKPHHILCIEDGLVKEKRPHREDGPAIEWDDQPYDNSYWLNGEFQRYTEESQASKEEAPGQIMIG